MKDIGEGDLGVNPRVDQIGHSVTKGSPPLRCFFAAVLPRPKATEMEPSLLHAAAKYCEHNEDLIDDADKPFNERKQLPELR